MLHVREVLGKEEKERKNARGILERCEIEFRRETKALKRRYKNQREECGKCYATGWMTCGEKDTR